MSRFIDLGKLWEAWQGDPEKKVSVKKEWLREVHSRLIRLQELEVQEQERLKAAMEIGSKMNAEEAMPLMAKMFAGMDPDKAKEIMALFQPKV